MTKEFFESVLRIPTCSSHEDMMIEFLMDWGPKHGCKTTKDGKGNVYMVKGSAKHPVGCINHSDSVHHDQIEMVREKVFKELIWNGDTVTAKNPITGKQTGLGMDNQGGCCIALAVIERVPAIKAMFPVEEEIGCAGTKASKYVEFFKDCSFVFSNDSPDRNRATHYSSGVQLYSDEFFKKFIQPVFAKHGVTDFRSEPWTDCKFVRSDVKGEDGKHLEVINAGNGGYSAHTDREYAKFSEVCAAEDMMVALCEAVGTETQYTSDISPEPRSWSYGYGSSYGGYGGRRSSWGSYWQDRYAARQSALSKSAGNGHDFTDKAEFTWIAPDAEKAGILKKQLGGFPKGMLEVVSKATDKGESVTVKAQYRDLKFAYLAALNCETGKAYRNWWEMEKAEPEAARRFEQVIRWEKPADPSSKSFWADEPEKTTSSEAALTIAFKDETQVDRFMDRLQKEAIAVDVDDTVPDEVTVSGDLQGVKDAYVVAFNVLNKKGLREFRELSSAAKDRFWSNVVWGSGSDPDDEKPEGGDDDAIEVDAEVLPSSEEPKYDEGDLWDWYNSRQ